MKRIQLYAILGMIFGGIIGIIVSTQPWIEVTFTDSDVSLAVPGAEALSVMAPLSLAGIAAGITLALVGTVFRYVLGAIATLIGASMLIANIGLVVAPGREAVSGAISKATGLSGDPAMDAMLGGESVTAMAYVGILAWILILAGGVLTLLTASRWPQAGRKYREAPSSVDHSGPLDKIDSWDELSRGDDPTQGG